MSSPGVLVTTDHWQNSNTSEPFISTPSTVQNETADYWENQVGDYLYSSTALLIFLVGTTGNVLSFLVFNQKSMRHSVTSLYFRVLAISDTLVLLSGPLLFWFLGTFHIDIVSISSVWCKLLVPLLLSSCYISCWILVFIAMDRSVGIFMPHKYKIYCTKPRATASMILLSITVLTTVGVYNVVALEVDAKDGCGIQQEFKSFHKNVYAWLDLVLLNLLPTVILVTLNILIIQALKTRLTRTATMTVTKNSTEANKKTAQDRGATMILISASVVYILCTIPSSTGFLLKPLFGTDAHAKAQRNLYQRVCLILYSINHGVNFFIYCLHGEIFRRELRGIFGKKRAKYSDTSSGRSTFRSHLKDTTGDSTL